MTVSATAAPLPAAGVAGGAHRRELAAAADHPVAARLARHREARVEGARVGVGGEHRDRERDRSRDVGVEGAVSAKLTHTTPEPVTLRVEQVTDRERKRIAADLHDDLGAKLLTIVHTSESERISSLAREALEEMRLSVRGLTGRPVRLIDALGDWRAEVVARLGQAGIDADWTTPADELPQTLSARAFVQTTRILREAVSNVIKHSGATHCSLICTLAEGDLLSIDCGAQVGLWNGDAAISVVVGGREAARPLRLIAAAAVV